LTGTIISATITSCLKILKNQITACAKKGWRRVTYYASELVEYPQKLTTIYSNAVIFREQSFVSRAGSLKTTHWSREEAEPRWMGVEI